VPPAPSAALLSRGLLAAAVLAGAALSGAVLGAAPATAAEAGSASLTQRAEQLQARIDEVGQQLATDAVAYEAAEDELAQLTRRQFAARSERDALRVATHEARQALHGLARSAYKGGAPPIMTALLSGDPGALSDLVYVQRSLNRLGADRTDVSRELVTRQADAGAALARSDSLRRDALGQQQRLEEQGRELADRTTALTAELERVGAELVRARAAEQLAEQESAALAARALQVAAERAAQDAAQAAGRTYVPSPYPTQVGADGSCRPPGGYAEPNGFLSPGSLCPLTTASGHRLRTDAARAFDALNAARLAATGTPLCITDSYRDYPSQVDVFRRKPGLAATPGRSQHGWGLAVDLCGGVQTFGSEPHQWMQLNAPAYGWRHPAWAGLRGSRPEAWHWEYYGA
jgi:LAS superfamily LD-carboxypeptidase LdcB